MDPETRRAQLIAAAMVLRTVVHAQRATWCDDARLRSEVPPRAFPDPWPPMALAGGAAVDAVSSTFSDAPLPEMSSDSPAVDLRTRAVDIWQALADAQARAFSMAHRWWREGLVALMVFATIGTVRVYWPVWKSAVSSELSAGRKAMSRRRADDGAQPGRGGSPAAATAAATVSNRGALQVQTTPEHARVSVDGRDRGESPLLLEDLTPGKHTVVLQTPDGSVRHTVSITAGQTTQLSESIFSGWLHVSSSVELQISEGKKAIRLDDRNQALLTAGPHDVRLENRAVGFSESRHVDIRPGATTAISIEPPESPISVTSNEPAEVSIDGEVVGETPLEGRTVKVGTREFVLTSRSGTIRRITISVTVQPTQVDVDFSRP